MISDFSTITIEIDEKKLSNYLLNENHPTGFSKAKFFKKHRFNNTLLRDTLSSHFFSSKKEQIITDFGIKVVCTNLANKPNGETFLLCSVWMIKNKVANFITAYPLL